MINKSDFMNPGAIFRPTPFWGLNGHLESTELRRQIHEFYQQGMGGVYLHPRGGMETDYLSEEYFEAMRVCIEECDRLGILAWLYDEDWCPSGKAGDKVVRLNPDFAQSYLKRIGDENVIIQCKDDNGSYRHVNVDVCNKEVIDAFIRITHEEYYKRFKAYFGNVIPAIFTDEPHFELDDKEALPWTKDFDLKFKEKYGYDLLECTAELFEKTLSNSETPESGLSTARLNKARKVKFDYWNLMSALFVEAFSKNIYDWCDEKGIAYTGHFWEHVFPSPKHQGSVMPHYEYMHYPGIDMLFIADEGNPEQYGFDLIVKEASSVANQFGRERVLSETNGASGWGLDFAYAKRALDWQLALGINLYVVHLSLYSMVGYRKRDFPLSYLDHQPWWEDFRLLSDYIGRMSYALSRGQYVADVLVVHPSSSTWVVDQEEAKVLAVSARNLTESLGQLRTMYDLGDDVIMAKHGKVSHGRLSIGEMAYKMIILPELYLLRQEVFSLLQAFVASGGTLVCTGKTPYLLDGEPSKELVNFFLGKDILHLSNEPSVLAKLLADKEVERVYLTETNGRDLSKIYAHVRRDENYKLIFLSNLDLEASREVWIHFPKAFAVEKYDGLTGETSDCTIYVDESGANYMKFTIHALESLLFLVNEEKERQVEAQVERQRDDARSELATEEIISLKDWTVRTLDPNAINLQFAKAYLNGQPFETLGDVLKIDDKLKDALGMDRGAIFTREPWMYSEAEKNDLHAVAVAYPFDVDMESVSPLFAAVELPEHFTVFINGMEVSPTGEFYKDRAFSLYDITDGVKKGENILRIETKEYGVLINLESVYIIGEFALKQDQDNDGYVLGDPQPLHPGNIVLQGYPYYTGRIIYETEVVVDEEYDYAHLHFSKFQGVTLTVKVNGEKVHTLGWPPYQVDLSGWLKKGKNHIILELANSLQNLLGPHGIEANQNLVHHGSFYTDKHEVFFPTGFDGQGEIRLRKK